MKAKRLYRWTCGCITHGTKKDGRLRCESHYDATIICKAYDCAECGKYCEVYYKSTSWLCPECALERHRAKRRVYEKERRCLNKPPVRHKDSPVAPHRNDDCFFYAECMSCGGVLIRDDRACVKCDRYMPVSIQVTMQQEWAMSEQHA